MADLSACPRIDPPLMGRAPAPEGEEVDRGPEFIDAETVEQVAEQVKRGVVVWPPEAEGAVQAVKMELLEAAFVKNLRSSMLSARTPLPHRTFALVAAVREMALLARTGVTEGGEPVAPSGSQVGVMVTNLELYAGGARARLAAAMPDLDEALVELSVSKAGLLPAGVVSDLTGLTVQQLASMRHAGVGPVFLRLPNRRDAVRYPLGGLLAWLYAGGR